MTTATAYKLRLVNPNNAPISHPIAKRTTDTMLKLLTKEGEQRDGNLDESTREFYAGRQHDGMAFTIVKAPHASTTAHTVTVSLYGSCLVSFTLDWYPACCGIYQLNGFSSSIKFLGTVKQQAEFIQLVVQAAMGALFGTTRLHRRIIINLVTRNFDGAGNTTSTLMKAYKQILVDYTDKDVTALPSYLYYGEWHYWAGVIHTPENQVVFRNENSGNFVIPTFVEVNK